MNFLDDEDEEYNKKIQEAFNIASQLHSENQNNFLDSTLSNSISNDEYKRKLDEAFQIANSINPIKVGIADNANSNTNLSNNVDYSELKTINNNPTNISNEQEKLSFIDNIRENTFSAGSFSDGYQFGDVTKAVAGTAADVVEDVAAGVFSIVESILDIGANIVASVQDVLGLDEEAKKTREFANIDASGHLAKGLVSMSVLGQLNYLLNGEYDKIGIYSNKSLGELFSNNYIYDSSWEKNSLIGTVGDSATRMIGYSAGLAITGNVFGASSSFTATVGGHTLELPKLAVAGGMANKLTEMNLKGDSVTELERWSSAISAGVIEGTTEGMFEALGVGGSDITNQFISNMTSKVSSKGGKLLTQIGLTATGEAIEELTAYTANYFMDNALLDKLGDTDLSYDYDFDEVATEMVLAFATTTITSGGSSVINTNRAIENAEKQLGRSLTDEEKVQVTQQLIDQAAKDNEAIHFDPDEPYNVATFYTTSVDNDGNITTVNETVGEKIDNPNVKVNVAPAIIKNSDTGNYNIIDSNTGVLLDSSPYESLIQAKSEFSSKMINLNNKSIEELNNKIKSRWEAIGNKAIDAANDMVGKILDNPQAVQNQSTDNLNNKTTNDTSNNINNKSFEDIASEAMLNIDTEETASPLQNRNIETVGKQTNVNAYQYDNPEVKPYFQEMAQMIGEDLSNISSNENKRTLKGGGTTLLRTTKAITQLHNEMGYSYNQIAEGLQNIIEDDGKENNAISKKLEIIIDEQLRNGYTNSSGKYIAPNQAYINTIKQDNVKTNNNIIENENRPNKRQQDIEGNEVRSLEKSNNDYIQALNRINLATDSFNRNDLIKIISNRSFYLKDGTTIFEDKRMQQKSGKNHNPKIIKIINQNPNIVKKSLKISLNDAFDDALELYNGKTFSIKDSNINFSISKMSLDENYNKTINKKTDKVKINSVEQFSKICEESIYGYTTIKENDPNKILAHYFIGIVEYEDKKFIVRTLIKDYTKQHNLPNKFYYQSFEELNSKNEGLVPPYFANLSENKDSELRPSNINIPQNNKSVNSDTTNKSIQNEKNNTLENSNKSSFVLPKNIDYSQNKNLTKEIFDDFDTYYSKNSVDSKRMSDFLSKHFSDFDDWSNNAVEYAKQNGNLVSMILNIDNNLVKLTTTKDGNRLYINELYVEKQKQGVGSKIVDLLKQYANEANLALETDRELSSAKGFWDKTLNKTNNTDNIKNSNKSSFSIPQNNIQGLENYSREEIKSLVKNYIQSKIDETELTDTKIKDLEIIGSRNRGTAKNTSDLDIVVEYEGDTREDTLFDILNEEPFEIDGIKVDINPINKNKTGTLEEYLKRSNEYDKEIKNKQLDTSEKNNTQNINIQDFGEKIGGARKDLGIQRNIRPGKEVIHDYTVTQTEDGYSVNFRGKVLKDDFKTQKAAEQYIIEFKDNIKSNLAFTEEGKNRDGETVYIIRLRNPRTLKSTMTNKMFKNKQDAESYALALSMYLKEYGKNLFRPQIQKIERVNPNTKNATKATGENILKDFGFRGGEFGNWVTQNERQQFLNYAQDAFNDLAEALDIIPDSLGQKNTMAIAFGARGKGLTGAVAHFEPIKKVINMTRLKGAGSLAHEYGHSIDNFLSREGGYDSDGMVTTSYRNPKFPEKVRTAIDDVINAMEYNISENQEEIDKKNNLYEKSRISNLESHLSRLDKIFKGEATTYKYNRKTKQYETPKIEVTKEQQSKYNKIRKILMEGKLDSQRTFVGKSYTSNDYEYSKPLEDLKALYKEVVGRKANEDTIYWLYRYGQPAKQVSNVKTQSAYYKSARELDEETGRATAYFSRRDEMWARAFESYVYDKLKAKGITNTYLVHSVNNDRYSLFNPYPAGEERQNINKAFDNLIQTMKEEGLFNDKNNISSSISNNTNDNGVRYLKKNSNKNRQDDYKEFNDIINKNEIEIRKNLNNTIDNVYKGFQPIKNQILMKELPKIIQELGVNNTPLMATPTTIRNAILTKEEAENIGYPTKNNNYHGLGKNGFNNVLDNLYSPVMVIRENEKKIIIFTEEFDYKNRQVIVPLEINTESYYNTLRVKANVMLSAHGRNSMYNYVNKLLSNSAQVVFQDKNKIQNLFDGRKVQYPESIYSVSNNSIAQQEDYVKQNNKTLEDSKVRKEVINKSENNEYQDKVQRNAERQEAYIEQEIQKIEKNGDWDNSIPVTKLSDIRKVIEDYLGLGIKRGHFRQDAYGIYKNGRDIIRTKEYKDIDTILHETGHALDLGKRLDIDKERIANELLVAIDKIEGYEDETRTIKLEEGFAEVIREYGVVPEQAKVDYPQTVAIIESFRAENQQFDKFISKVQEMTYNYIHQNPRNRVLSNQSIGEQTDKAPLSKAWIKQEVMRNVWDKDYALKEAVDVLANKQGKTSNSIKASDNAYLLTRLSSGIGEKVSSMLSNGYIDPDGNKTMPGLNQLGEILGNDPDRFNDLRTYLVAKRDMDYKAKTLKTGIRTMDSKAVVEQFKNDTQIQKAAQVVYDTLDGVMQYAIDNGLITEENAKAIKKSNAFYVPMHRVLENRGNQTGRRGAVTDIIKKRTGSELDIKDVLENIVANSSNVIQQVENNNILKALYKEGEAAGLTGAVYDVISTPMTKVGTAQLNIWEQELINQGIDTSEIDFEKTIDLFAPNNKIDTKNLITSFIDNNGKRVYLQFNDEIVFNSLMNLDKNIMSQVLKINRKMNMPLRYGATMANIGFAIPNMISDTAQATIYSTAGFVPVVSNVLGVLDILTAKNKTVGKFVKQVAPDYANKINFLYELYEQTGATSATRLSQYRKSTQEIMKNIYGTKNSKVLGIEEKFKPLKRLLDLMTYIPELSEQSTRFEVFRRNYDYYKRKGTSETDARIMAAIESRDATQDFGRTGNITREINQIIPFSAARVGSLYTFAEKIKANPKQVGFKIALLTALALAIKGIGYDDKEIEELNQRKKDDNFVLKIGDNVVTIKKPQGILRSIINLAEYIEDLSSGHIEEGKEGERLGQWINNAIMDNMPSDEVTGLVPNMVAPIIENAVNKDFYYNTDIVKSYDLDLPDNMQYYDYNSQLAIWLGNIFNYSPAKIDNLISGYFGGLGTQVTGTIDYWLGKMGVIPEKTEMGAEQDAVGKRFVVNVNSNSQSIDDIYKRKTELTKKKNGGTITEEEEEELETIQNAITNISALNKQIKAIKQDLTTSGTEKAELIRPLQEQKTDTARQALGKELIYEENAEKIEATNFYPTRSSLSYNGYTLELTNEMKKEYEELASDMYKRYEQQGLYSDEYLETLKSKSKDYAKKQMIQKYKSQLIKSK